MRGRLGAMLPSSKGFLKSMPLLALPLPSMPKDVAMLERYLFINS